MTVSTEISSNEYTGNGVTTDFDYKFRIFKENQLSVITSDADGGNVVTLRLGTDYTVTGANKSAGGKVILTKPLANGHKISIARDIPIKQETSFRNQSKFFAETHEDAFDYLTMIIQRVWESLGSLYLKRPNILANWFDAKGYRIANLGKPKRDSDAVDLGTLKDEISDVNSTILKREKRLLRVDDVDIAALPKASERSNKQIGFDSLGIPTLFDPAETGALGYILVDSFEKGALITGRYQALHFEYQGEFYRWDGGLPKQVPAGSTPQSTGGIGKGAWVSVGDASLRAEVDLYAIARANAVSMSDVQFLSVGQTVNGQHYWYDRASEKIYLWVEPVSEGVINGVVTDSDGVIKITVGGTDYELYSLSDFSLSLGDSGILVLLNRNLEAAINLANKLTKIREIKLGVGDFLLKAIQLKKGITISGSGIDLGDLEGTRLKFDLQANEDAFAYLGTTYPPATITIQSLTMENANFAIPTDAAGAQAILNANNRGFWGVRNQPATDWKPEADWQKKKDGGANCQNLFIKNVVFEKFAYAWDVHTWMSKFEDVQTRHCGTSRTYGTSTDFDRVWPQYCLYSAYQLGMVYSRMNSSSMGEQNITGINAHGLQNFRGAISLYDCGWENVLGTVYDCVDGVVNVHNEIYVTDKSRKAALWGRVRSASARLNFFGVNKSYDSDGDMTDPSWNWFQADLPEWLKNIQFHEPLYENNLPVRYPHRSLEKNWTTSFYRGFFAHEVDSPKGELYFIPPTRSSRLRRVPCMDIAYKDSFIVLGDESKVSVRFDIYGSFADDALSSKPKTGTLKVKITPEASVRPSTSGLIFYSEIGASEYVFTWSHDGTNIKGGQVRTGAGFNNQGDRNTSPINAYFTGELNNDGFRVLLSVRAINNVDNNNQEWKENVKYRVEFEYNGSCNNNALSTGNKRFEVQIVQ